MSDRGGVERPTSARRLALALERHCAALAACRRCEGMGATIAPILSEARAPLALLVGQAPGRVETGEDRRPFAGRAGKTLFRWLGEAGIVEAVARERIYIAAITRCFPGASPSGRGDRVPSPVEIAQCAGWLDAELRLIGPRVIIPVGRLAIDRFLGAVALADVVGGEHPVRHAGGESLAIPLPHPSGASSWIHQPGHRTLLDRALALIRRRLPELVRESQDADGTRVA